ncbi:MAG TPA: MFS transporter [Microvirga sp.]|nr:MFS transporter [Microvirga sp.]
MSAPSPSYPTQMPWGFVASLSLAQLVSWGSVFYAFALFMTPMADELGWTKPELTAAYSLGLMASGVCAVPAGRLIDLGYGRLVMTGGSLLAAALLALWSQIESLGWFLVLWIGLGAAMSAILYEPGFAVLTFRLGPLSRRAITFMTLVGGLASTVFIPLTHLLIEAFGWRGALLALAAVNLGICVVIHAFMIPPQARPQGTARVPAPPSGARRVLRQAAFWGFVGTCVLQGVISTGIPIHLIPLLVEHGIGLDGAVLVYALIGPAQVAARFGIALGGQRLNLKLAGIVTMALTVLAVALLPWLAGGWAVAAGAAVVWGASNGLMTILRALLPPELFGREDYGAIQGLISMPVTFAKATAPFAFGALWAWSGSYEAVVTVWIALALGAAACFAATLLAARRGSRARI